MSVSPPLYIPTIAEQKTILSSGLHSALILQFLMGIYIGVFVVTISIYGCQGHQNRSYNKAIAASIVVLFLITLTSLMLCWYSTNNTFCNHGNIRFSIFSADSASKLPFPLHILLDITGMAGFILADGALLWRCFHACGGTLTASFLLPMGMFIVEIALAFASLAFDILTEHPKPGTALIYHKVYNQISGAAFTVIAATSSIATFLICTTIYTYTTHSRSARKRLRHVVDTLTQSCGIYTAVAIMHAILNIKLDTGYLNNSTTITVFGLNKYSMSLIYVTSGLVPTLMVARLATSSNPTDVVDTESEPASLVSLPPQLGGQPDPERASIDAVHIQLDKASSSDGDVDHDGSILVDESRGRRIVGGYEELIIGALDGQAAAVMINGGSVE